MRKYAIIMAGGNGERLFPLSTKKKPKQFLNLYGQECMINETIKRVEKVIPIENIFIIINKVQEDLANKYIDRRIKNSHILVEPKKLNTAVCIGYATTYIVGKYGDGIITVFSSDHYIIDDNKFNETIQEAISSAEEKKKLIMVGIKADFPCTQFGYINCERTSRKIKKVINFIEKPSYEEAKEYLNKGYYWNSGIFIWNSKTIMSAYEKFLPDLYSKLKYIQKFIYSEELKNKLDELYNKVNPISIDIGILEKATNVMMIEATFKWIDIGNLNVLLKLYENDPIKKKYTNRYISIESNNIRTFSEIKNKKFAIIGIDNIIIVDTEEICLVADEKKLDKVRDIVKKINLQEGNEL